MKYIILFSSENENIKATLENPKQNYCQLLWLFIQNQCNINEYENQFE